MDRIRARLISVLQDPDHGSAIRDDLRQGLPALPERMQAIVRDLLRGIDGAAQPQPKAARAVQDLVNRLPGAQIQKVDGGFTSSWSGVMTPRFGQKAYRLCADRSVSQSTNAANAGRAGMLSGFVWHCLLSMAWIAKGQRLGKAERHPGPHRTITNIGFDIAVYP
jgi:hypothetical protein